MEYEVIATLGELKSAGLDEDELGARGKFIKDHNDGWVELEIKGGCYPEGIITLDFPKDFLRLKQ